jgi:hypothetical protein
MAGAVNIIIILANTEKLKFNAFNIFNNTFKFLKGYFI